MTQIVLRQLSICFITLFFLYCSKLPYKRKYYYAPVGIYFVFTIARYIAFSYLRDDAVFLIDIALTYLYIVIITLLLIGAVIFVKKRYDESNGNLLYQFGLVHSILYCSYLLIMVVNKLDLLAIIETVMLVYPLIFLKRFIHTLPVKKTVMTSVLQSIANLYELNNVEIQILGMVMDNKMNKEIAWDLAFSEQKIKNKLTGIYKKMNVRNRIELVNTVNRLLV